MTSTHQKNLESSPGSVDTGKLDYQKKTSPVALMAFSAILNNLYLSESVIKLVRKREGLVF